MLNEFERQREFVEKLKRTYPQGTRIKLVCMSDSLAPVPSGTQGTVTVICSNGIIGVDWDNGSQLGLIPEDDEFEIISKPQEVSNV